MLVLGIWNMFLSLLLASMLQYANGELGIEDVIESYEMSLVKSHQNFDTTKMKTLEDMPHIFSNLI